MQPDGIRFFYEACVCTAVNGIHVATVPEAELSNSLLL